MHFDHERRDVDLKRWKIEPIYVAFFSVVLLVAGFVLIGYFYSQKTETDFASLETMVETHPIEMEEETRQIVIDIKGAVKNPGVYEMEEGSRMYEAIERAGGFLEEADESRINLAQLLHDEMMVYIPFQGEAEAVLSDEALASEGKIPLNRADQAMLEKLPGIGPAKAEAIIAYREEHGDFKDVNELLNVSGIGPKTFEKLKEHVTLY